MNKYKSSELQNLSFSGIEMYDWPDLCDAYIDYAENFHGKSLSDEELEWVNENGVISDFHDELLLQATEDGIDRAEHAYDSYQDRLMGL